VHVQLLSILYYFVAYTTMSIEPTVAAAAAAAAASSWGVLDTLPYLELFVGFAIVVTFMHLYLDVRQLKAIKLPKPPPVLAEHFDDELYKKTQAYSLDKWWFGFAHGLYSFTENLAILLLRGLPWLWRVSGQVLAHVPAALRPWLLLGADGKVDGRKEEIVHTILFVMLMMGMNLAFELPWSLYSTFVVEQRHGFNKQTLGLFFSDMLKSVLLGALLIPPVVAGITYILQISTPFLALYLWAFMLGLTLFFMTIYPTLIAPLFNKYETLPEGSLRSKIEALAGSLHFPLKKLFKVDGSKRSAHSNAYMYGFWGNKRIVLYDTLLTQCNEEQVVAVLAHELGHWKLRHTHVLFALGQSILLAQFSVFTFIRTCPHLFESFGFGGEGVGYPAFISLVLFQYISSPMDEVIHYLQNLVSRTFEFQADSFAIKMGHGEQLRSALLRLEEENKSTMNVDSLYSAYHYSHPPLAERLKAIDSGVAARGKKAS